MKRMIFGLAALALVVSVLAGSTATTSAAHFGNNMADIAGTGDADAQGQSLVNYRKGTGSFNASVSVSQLDPGETYTFLVRNAAGVEREICEATASDQGMFMCNAQDVLPNGFGLVRAVVRDSAGDEAAVGLFDRRGNCRVPDQAGSQCEAPGHQH